MSIVVVKFGALTLLADFVFQKVDGGIYYFRRRIPDDVLRHYPGKKKPGFIYFSLKTRNAQEAARKANQTALEQNALWKTYRSGEVVSGPDENDAAVALLSSFGLKPGDAKVHRENEPGLAPFFSELANWSMMMGGPQGDHELATKGSAYDYLPPVQKTAHDLLFDARRPVFLSGALKEFLKRHGEDESTKTGQDRIRTTNNFIGLVGDLPVDKYNRSHANRFVEWLADTQGNKKATIRRRLNSLRPVLKEASREHELGPCSIFDSIHIPESAGGSLDRLPFTKAENERIQKACLEQDDDVRWIVGLLSDSGMRLSEAVGLLDDDVFLNEPVPYVHIRFNPIRRLKNKGSIRRIPLVGMSLWAAGRALENSRHGYLFPRYIDSQSVRPKHKGDHASNTINKWLRTFDLEMGDQKSSHCFRHTLNDRLREVQCPAEIRDAICGWTTKGMGQNYGDGFPLSVLVEHMAKIVTVETPLGSELALGNE